MTAALRVSFDALNRRGIRRCDFRTVNRNGVKTTTCALAGMLSHPLIVDPGTKCLTVDNPQDAQAIAAFLARQGVDCSPELF